MAAAKITAFLAYFQRAIKQSAFRGILISSQSTVLGNFVCVQWFLSHFAALVFAKLTTGVTK